MSDPSAPAPFAGAAPPRAARTYHLTAAGLVPADAVAAVAAADPVPSAPATATAFPPDALDQE